MPTILKQFSIVWQISEGRHREELGLIPLFLSASDDRSAAKQLDANYQHGGGWRPMKGWRLLDNDKIEYPGDPAYPIIAYTMLRDEKIVVYPYGWVAIIQPDRSFEVSRMD